MKRFILFGFLVFIIAIVVINYRTPFLQEEGGPWSIGFGFSENIPEKIDFQKNELYSAEKLKKISDSTSFLADPFFIKEKDSFYIFIEHKKSGKSNADIAVLTSADGKNYAFKGTVLNQKFHLSYPQVFKYKNEFYMVPETKQAGAILLYKAHKFPFDWRISDTLVHNVNLKDPTLYLSDSLNIMVASDDNMKMFMYEADSLKGKWKLHKKSVALMGTEARAGGRFISTEKGLFLPVQNCTHGYGFGLSLYKFNFNDGSYEVRRERPFFMIANDSIKEFSAGMHHFDIQKIDEKYYFVYDGNTKSKSNTNFNWKGPLKWNFIDLKNWFYQQ